MEKYPCILFHHIKTGVKKNIPLERCFCWSNIITTSFTCKAREKQINIIICQTRNEFFCQWSTCNFVCLNVFPHILFFMCSTSHFHCHVHMNAFLTSTRAYQEGLQGLSLNWGGGRGSLMTNHLFSLYHIDKCFSILDFVNRATLKVVTTAICSTNCWHLTICGSLESS